MLNNSRCDNQLVDISSAFENFGPELMGKIHEKIMRPIFVLARAKKLARALCCSIPF
jgi:hypothetical protein